MSEIELRSVFAHHYEVGAQLRVMRDATSAIILTYHRE